MIEQTITTNVIIASDGCKLTQAADVAIQDRVVTDKVYLSKTASADDWREITEEDAARIQAQQQELMNLEVSKNNEDTSTLSKAIEMYETE